MAVVHCQDQLLEEPPSFVFVQASTARYRRGISTAEVCCTLMAMNGADINKILLPHVKLLYQSNNKCHFHDLLCSDKLVQIAASSILHCYAKIFGRQEALSEADNVRVYQAGMVDDLPLHLQIWSFGWCFSAKFGYNNQACNPCLGPESGKSTLIHLIAQQLQELLLTPVSIVIKAAEIQRRSET